MVDVFKDGLNADKCASDRFSKLTSLTVVRSGTTDDGYSWFITEGVIPQHYNGYVMLPEGHKFVTSWLYSIDEAVRAPGGVTFFEDGVIGFDTIHAYHLDIEDTFDLVLDGVSKLLEDCRAAENK